MWLIMAAVAALTVTLIWLRGPRQSRLSMLSLALWGLTICVLVDHVFGWEGGAFFEISADAFCLSLVMLAAVVGGWAVWAYSSRLKGTSVNQRTEE